MAGSPSDAAFGPKTTAMEVVDGVDLSGKRAVVTGGGSGIGIETVRALAAAGADVTMAVRDVEAGKRVAENVNGQVRVSHLDLLDPASVRAFADSWVGPLHVLVNNAGVMALPTVQRTATGWEHQFAANHLGHFGLSVLLQNALVGAGGARIVAVSSSSHNLSPVVFDDINFRYRPYDPFAAYAQSKTANVLFAVGASQRWLKEGITTHAVMPGLIPSPIQRHIDPDFLAQAQEELLKVVDFKSAAQGAATSLYAATAPNLEGLPAMYLEDCQEAPIVEESGLVGVAPYALDPDNADRLWHVSREALQLDEG